MQTVMLRVHSIVERFEVLVEGSRVFIYQIMNGVL
jgi:hypothetical protein